MLRPKIKHLGSDTTVRPLAKGETPLTHEVRKGPLKELAEVLEYNTNNNTYKVVTRGVMGDASQPQGRQLNGVPRKMETPGVIASLGLGTVVIIDYSLGFPYIDGVLNIGASRAQAEDNPNVAANIAGDASIADPTDNTEQDDSGYYREANMPKDMVGGDWLVTTPEGNRIAALRGKHNVMDGGIGTKAKIETFGNYDLVRITAEDFELNTGFGILRILNTEGRCGLSFRAASDQLTESGGEEEQWTFKLDIGDDGDFFNLEVSAPEGATAARFKITPDGKVTLLGAQGVDIIGGNGAPSHQEFGSDLVAKILGKVLRVVEGSVTEEVQSNRVTTVSETDRRTVGHNDELAVNNHQIHNVGGNQYLNISGGTPLEAIPTNIAVEAHVLNGNYHLELGNPLRGANPAAQASMTLAVNNGDIVLGQNPDILAPQALRATASLNTILPNSVGLGGTANPLSTNPALFHAVKFEQLSTFLQIMMTMFDTHTHVPPVGGVPISLMNTALSALLTTLMSTRVVIGA